MYITRMYYLIQCVNMMCVIDIEDTVKFLTKRGGKIGFPVISSQSSEFDHHPFKKKP